MGQRRFAFPREIRPRENLGSGRESSPLRLDANLATAAVRLPTISPQFPPESAPCIVIRSGYRGFEDVFDEADMILLNFRGRENYFSSTRERMSDESSPIPLAEAGGYYAVTSS